MWSTYLIPVPQSLVRDSKYSHISKGALWISEEMAQSPNRDTAACLFHFILSFWIGLECYHRQWGQDSAGGFAASTSYKASYWLRYGWWMRKQELAECCGSWSYIHIIDLFCEPLPRKYIEGVELQYWQKWFCLWCHWIVCACVYWMLNIIYSLRRISLKLLHFTLFIFKWSFLSWQFYRRSS